MKPPIQCSIANIFNYSKLDLTLILGEHFYFTCQDSRFASNPVTFVRACTIVDYCAHYLQ